MMATERDKARGAERKQGRKARKGRKRGRPRIVIGYDGTDAGIRMLRDLERAGLPDAAEALVLTFLKPWASFAAGPADGAPGWPGAAARRQYQRQLEDMLRAAGTAAAKAAKVLAKRFPGWSVRAEAALDDPAHGLLARAEAWPADLLVVGSHGRGFLGRVLLGSVSDKVVRHARVDVRIARTGSITRAYPPRVLVGIDGSDASLGAARAAASRPWPAGTQVRVVGVVDARALLEAGDARTVWLEKRVAEAARLFDRKGLRCVQVLAEGDPRGILLSEAKGWKADGIFLGSTGRTGVDRWLLGSVASALAAQAPCSVEIVRSD